MTGLRRRWLLAALLGCVLPAWAGAHAHLTASTPAAGSRGAAPPEFVLHFAEATRLTAVTLQRDGAAARQLEPLPTRAGTTLRLRAPTLAAGDYVLTWRGLGDDGHVVSGTVRFTIQAP
jgi:methionine-rich copper-binding protein CopC